MSINVRALLGHGGLYITLIMHGYTGRAQCCEGKYLNYMVKCWVRDKSLNSVYYMPCNYFVFIVLST